MLTFPIPLFASVVLGFLFARNLFRRDLPPLLAALLLVCAIQNAIVALVQFYGVDILRPAQAIAASIIPVVAWVAFQYEAMERTSWQQFITHLSLPLLVVGFIAFAPGLIDGLLFVVFLAYGIAILIAVRSADGTLPAAQMSAGPIPARIWQTIAIVLICMALIDATISLMLSIGHSWLHQWILSAASSCLLLIIGLLGTAPEISGRHSPASLTHAASTDAETLKEDSEITSKLEGILHQDKLYLDPDLTLIRLARKLGIPGKQLSASVNRHTKNNISRFINRFRVEHACSLLESGETITNAMLKSGFNTKSNFNREFRRVTGKTPSDWNK